MKLALTLEADSINVQALNMGRIVVDVDGIELAELINVVCDTYIVDALTSPGFILISTASKIFDSGDFSFNLISAYYVIQRIKDII